MSADRFEAMARERLSAANKGKDVIESGIGELFINVDVAVSVVASLLRQAAGDWRPIADLPTELQELPRPRLGSHVCQVETASDGLRWMVEFHPTNGKALRCFLLPTPPESST